MNLVKRKLPEIPMVPIDGGPCAGKTSILCKLSEAAIDVGFTPFLVPESATILINAGMSPTSDFFQEALIREGLQHEELIKEYIRKNDISNPIVFLDRAIPSGRAYVDDPKTFDKLIKKFGFKNYGQLLANYAELIFLESVAVDKPEAYTTVNNSARHETVDQAKERNEKQKLIWIGHEKIRVVDNSTDFEGKKIRAVAELYSYLKLPSPIGFERKFRVKDFNESMLAVPYQMSTIEQVYLNEDSCRIRKRSTFGHTVYYYAYKKWLPTGEHVKMEQVISKHQYDKFLDQRSSRHEKIRKNRYCFLYKNQYFEIDVFFERSSKPFLYVLEVKPTNKQEKIELPNFMGNYEDVTDNKLFRTEQLALSLKHQKL